MRLISQPVAGSRSQSAKLLSHAVMTHWPATQADVALASMQTDPQPPPEALELCAALVLALEVEVEVEAPTDAVALKDDE